MVEHIVVGRSRTSQTCRRVTRLLLNGDDNEEESCCSSMGMIVTSCVWLCWDRSGTQRQQVTGSNQICTYQSMKARVQQSLRLTTLQSEIMIKDHSCVLASESGACNTNTNQ
eukprot:scaffold6456_cov98-Skeletonema_dohrnii-CCMP3373.AAC.9